MAAKSTMVNPTGEENEKNQTGKTLMND